MLQSRLCNSVPGVAPAHLPSIHNLAGALNGLTLCCSQQGTRPQFQQHQQRSNRPQQLTFVRHASHAAQGRANGPKDSAGRRLGAKKTASQYVIPGNIIFKQRGTKWFPGENVGIGKDHTIYAMVSGYVRYYKNPALHPKRQYIGVALEKEGPGSILPTPTNAPTRRRLSMHAVPIVTSPETDAAFLEGHMSENSKGSANLEPLTSSTPTPTPVQLRESNQTPGGASATLKPGTFWESNYEIGKAAEKAGVKVREFDRGDRWLAWRKRAKRVKAGMLAKAAKANRKTKGKKSNKGIAPPTARR